MTDMTPPERLQDVTLAEVVAEMREWAHGEGCFNDDPEGEPLLCVYYSQQAFLRLCDQLEAAAALSVRGWQDIASAPKDGTRIILGRPDIDGDGGASASGYWEDALEDGVDYMGHDGGFTDSDYQVFSPGRSFGNPDYRYVGSQPTHWQPLPATPPSEG